MINVDVLTIISVDCRFITYAINVDVLTITSVDCRFITYAINVDVLTIISSIVDLLLMRSMLMC